MVEYFEMDLIYYSFNGSLIPGGLVAGVSLEKGNFCTLSALFNQSGYVTD